MSTESASAEADGPAGAGRAEFARPRQQEQRTAAAHRGVRNVRFFGFREGIADAVRPVVLTSQAAAMS